MLQPIGLSSAPCCGQADALDAVQEALIIAPGIAAAAAAAGAYSRANSTAGTSASLGSSVKLPRWPQICVDVSVYRVGGFRLKGVDNVVDVVQVTPLSMVARMEYIPPPCTKVGAVRWPLPRYSSAACQTRQMSALGQPCRLYCWCCRTAVKPARVVGGRMGLANSLSTNSLWW